MGNSLPMTVSPAGRALIGKNEPAKKKGTMATGGSAPMYSSWVGSRLASTSAAPYMATAKARVPATWNTTALAWRAAIGSEATSKPATRARPEVGAMWSQYLGQI